MSKTKKENINNPEEFDYEDDPIVQFEPSQITQAQEKLYAIFEDADGDFNQLPVILFSVGTFKTLGGDDGRMVVGMVSMHGGLEAAEHMEDMTFIGYWQEGAQDMESFLQDHGIDLPADLEGEEDEEE